MLVNSAIGHNDTIKLLTLVHIQFSMCIHDYLCHCARPSETITHDTSQKDLSVFIFDYQIFEWQEKNKTNKHIFIYTYCDLLKIVITVLGNSAQGLFFIF